MSAKRKEIQEIEGGKCEAQGAKHSSKTYVHFRNGHLQLDVRGFLKSREGKESVAKVIGLSKRMPKKAREEDDERLTPATS